MNDGLANALRSSREMTSVCLFDLDGTLWDSFPWYARVLADISPYSSEEIESRLRATPHAFDLGAIAPGVSTDVFVEACASRIGELCLYDGVLDTLDLFHSRDVRLGVVTNLPGWLSGRLIELKGLAKYFLIVIDADSGYELKPSAEPVLHAWQTLDAAHSGRIAFVGDTAADMQASIGAGVDFICCTYGYGDVAAGSRIYYVPSFRSIPGLFGM